MGKEYQPAVDVMSLDDDGTLTFVVYANRSFEDVMRDFKDIYAGMQGMRDTSGDGDG